MGVTRTSDDDDLRWYEDDDGTRILSVTTVLKWLDEDESGLDYWKRENDGSDESPHWQHLFWYSAPRGTLCHYQALKAFADAYDGDMLWGTEEAESMNQILSGPAEDAFEDYDSADAPTEESAVVYSILKDRGVVSSREQFEHLFSDTELVDLLWDDVEFFVETFEHVCEELGVDAENVMRVETYVHDSDNYIAGQTDLVYEDPESNVVVADLKTSSGLRQKHRLQSVAYMKAVELAEWGPDAVDRVEVWRISPTKKDFQVHSNKVPDHAESYEWYTDEHWFEDQWGDFEYDSIEDMWNTFSQLAEEAHDDAQS